MFDGEVYSDFVLLWLVCHQSRFEVMERQTECLLERWSKIAQEHGTRALDDLRRGVEEAIVSLGQGFLQHPLNTDLRTRLKRGELPAQDYYRQLLRLVYRLIFLFAAEDRDLLLLPDAPVEARQRFQNYYSTTRLRALAQKQRGGRHHDRYEALRLVMTLLGSDSGCPELALPALGGFLFDPRSTADLNDARLDNQALLSAVRSLAFITEGNTRRAVDYRNLGPEELGSVYESLLELHPLLNTDAGTFQLISAAGNERKTTGSYYTPSSLIQVLLDSALDPVIERAVAEAHREGAKDAKDSSDKEKNFARLASSRLLSLKVCDPACGSGHFLIAAAHRIAGRLAEVRAGDNEPSPNETRRALRDVIRHCIYGVDINPMAVELCKVNLWLESLEPGKPLSFLDAHIKCGNSLVGVGPKMDLGELEVPDEAFNAVTGDHKPTTTLLKKRNKQERAGQESLFVTVTTAREDLDKWLAERTRALEAMPEDSAAEVQAKAEAFRQVNSSSTYRKQQQLADLWTSAFFWKIEEPSGRNLEIVAPTHGQMNRLRSSNQTQTGLLDLVEKIRRSEGFFHWPLEFADVTSQGGFDCVLGNPPWEMMQLEEQEFFASRDPEIAALPGEQRKQAIKNLGKSNPSLANLFEIAKHNADALNKFFRVSGRFPLTATGKMNSYALFAEHFRNLMNAQGHAGVIVPTGIATDDTTKDFFGSLVEKRALASLFDFENKEGIFPGVHRSYKFCLLTLSGVSVKQALFAFFATRVEHLRDERRRFTLDPAEIALFNPNTRTMPVFRTRADAELTRAIYKRVPVLVNERTGENPWGVSFKQGLFNMTSDSGLFITEPREGYVRLYEAKMFWHYDHRWGTFEGDDTRELTIIEKKEPNYLSLPRYWVPKREMENRLQEYTHDWLIAFRDITNVTNERTSIFSIIPLVGVGHTAPLVFTSVSSIRTITCKLGCLDSIVLDYCARQKVGGTHLTYGYLRQFPVLVENTFTPDSIRFITTRVIELLFTAFDLRPFAEDILSEIGVDTWNAWFPHSQPAIGHSPQPFPWDEERRAVLRAELDAYYARLYGLNRKQLRYILDPADLTPRELEDILDPWEEVNDPLDPAGYEARRAASDFPGETFRVLKEKEIKQFGEYRTRRLVLEAWDRLEGNEVGNSDGYKSPSATVPPKQETIPVTLPKSESRPAAVQTHLPAPVKPPLPATPQPKVVKEIDPPADQPTLTDFGLYKCEVCGKM
ncbi:MAG TPA: N-6 DNA methylase, partial [Anaerolineaceae bacterium]|nr:N-6 DNA methylase [Anaerolineaceae bacterium]